MGAQSFNAMKTRSERARAWWSCCWGQWNNSESATVQLC